MNELLKSFGADQTLHGESFVTYNIYRDRTLHTDDDFLSFVRESALLFLSYVSQWTNSYIWQKDPFNLRVITPKTADPPYAYLQGSTRFGDCIEDEWFIVFLLVKLSEKFPDTVISVKDEDGEFLLVEAADHLPSWLEPSTSQNRVFIHKGHLHVIPKPRTPSEIVVLPAGDITVVRAVDLVRRNAPTTASAPLERAAFKRIKDYPSKSVQNIHRARSYVPRSVAYILSQDPQLIAPAVEAFYTRDPVALKACASMSHFPPSKSVMATLPFTKTLYSQIVSQQFYAPKLFRMPPPSAPEFKAHELGMKLACGFEMLMNDQHLRDLSSNATAEKTVETYHFEADRNWKSFVERLRTLGYFRNELEGSKLYKDLERRAKEEYLSQQSSQTSSDADNIPSVNPIDRINALLSEFQRHNDLTDNEFLSTVVPTLSGPEDSEAWMIVEPEDLDRMLAAQFGELAMRDGDDGGLIFDDEEEYEDDEVFDDDEGESNLEKANSRQKDKLKELDKMVRGLNTFVEKESGVGGAILPHERYVDPEESDDDDQKPSKAAGSTAPISFDFDKFLRIMGVPNTKGIQQPKEQNEYEPGEDSGEDEEEFRIYMEAMDRELSATKIGRDFASAATASTSEPSSTAPSTTATTEKAKETIVSGTEVGRAVSVEEKVELEEQEESDSRLRPVDINVNLVKNLLESFAAQEGLPGPASNLLGALGVRLPRLGDEKDDEDDEQ